MVDLSVHELNLLIQDRANSIARANLEISVYQDNPVMLDYWTKNREAHIKRHEYLSLALLDTLEAMERKL